AGGGECSGGQPSRRARPPPEPALRWGCRPNHVDKRPVRPHDSCNGALTLPGRALQPGAVSAHEIWWPRPLRTLHPVSPKSGSEPEEGDVPLGGAMTTASAANPELIYALRRVSESAAL